MHDRGTLAIKARKARMELVRRRIEEYPGIAVSKLEAGLSIELGVSEGKIEEYIRAYGDAGLIVARNGFLWTIEALAKAEENEREAKFLAEEKLIESSKLSGYEPIENYSKE